MKTYSIEIKGTEYINRRLLKPYRSSRIEVRDGRPLTKSDIRDIEDDGKNLDDFYFWKKNGRSHGVEIKNARPPTKMEKIFLHFKSHHANEIAARAKKSVQQFGIVSMAFFEDYYYGDKRTKDRLKHIGVLDATDDEKIYQPQPNIIKNGIEYYDYTGEEDAFISVESNDIIRYLYPNFHYRPLPNQKKIKTANLAIRFNDSQWRELKRIQKEYKLPSVVQKLIKQALANFSTTQ